MFMSDHSPQDAKKFIVPKELQQSPPAGDLSRGQQLLAPHVEQIAFFWTVLFFGVFLTMTLRTFWPALRRSFDRRPAGSRNADSTYGGGIL
jgi:hypothetical protein